MRRVDSGGSGEVTVTRAIWLDGSSIGTTGTSVATTSRPHYHLWGRRDLKRHATLLQQSYSKYQMTTHKRLDPLELLKASTSAFVDDSDDEDEDSDGPSQSTWRPYEGGCREEEPNMHVFSLPPFEDYDKEEPCGGN